MKRTNLIVALILLSACAAPQESQPTNAIVPPTETSTPVPTETPLPSPTPTPQPYYLEDGVLYDLDELSGEHVEIRDGIDSLTTTADGVIVALDGAGSPKFVFVEGAWIEITIPEGAENHEELAVPDRHVSIVNEQGKVEEVVESGVKVLVNPATGEYEYELVNGEWVDYDPRVQVVAEFAVKGDPKWSTEVPREVAETAVETVKNAQMLTRNGVELETGYDEVIGKHKLNNGYTYISWYGVFCGANMSNITFSGEPMGAAFMGVELNSGDVMLVPVMFLRNEDKTSGSYFAVIFDGGEVPEDRDSFNRAYNEYGEVINTTQLYEAVASAPVGTPFYVSTKIDPARDRAMEEMNNVIKALRTGELKTVESSLSWNYGDIGASDDFWKSVIDK